MAEIPRSIPLRGSHLHSRSVCISSSKNSGNCLQGNLKTRFPQKTKGYTCQSQNLGSAPSLNRNAFNNHGLYPTAKTKEELFKGAERSLNRKPVLLKHQHFDGVLNLEHMQQFFLQNTEFHI